MNDANQMTEVELPSVMHSLSEHTMVSFSTSANTPPNVDAQPTGVNGVNGVDHYPVSVILRYTIALLITEKNIAY